jgi:two-component system chemotaxis sensor kinase CheA
MDELRDQFLLEGRELAEQAGADLLTLERDPGNADLIARIFRAVHTMKGGAGLFDLGPLGSLLHAAEDLLDGLRRGVHAPDTAAISALIGAIVQVGRWLDDFERIGKLPGDAAKQGRSLEAVLRQACDGRAAEAMPAGPASDAQWARTLAAGLSAADAALTCFRYRPRGDCFFAGDDPLRVVQAVPDLRRLDIVPREPWGATDILDPFSCNLVFLGVSGAARAEIEAAFRFVPDQVELVALVAGNGGENAESEPETDTVTAAARMLRVPEARLDQLAETVDELLMAKNALAHLFAEIDAAGVDPALSRNLAGSRAALDRLVAGLHRTSVELRLVPLSPLLRRFPALARAIADGLGKQVQLTVGGDSLEVDKSVVDGLFEPLLHLVRNAVDHGIERAEAREAAGKPPGATIRLEARRAGDSFVIALTDDGAGIDLDRLRRTARERLGLDEQILASLSVQETLELVFRPGFSTSATVSELSGRGVGMDAVRTGVAALGGKVSIASTVGVGTTVSLTLPFRIVMSRIVTVESGAERFGVPVDAIVETVRVCPEQIQPVRHGRVFIWRDMVVPLFDLPVLLGSAGNFPGGHGLHAMIVGEGDRLAAISVDKFSDRVDVLLRPLEGYLSGIKGVSGTALTGDGNVLLVLDPVELVA